MPEKKRLDAIVGVSRSGKEKRTSVHEVIDLLYSHTRAFGGYQSSFLFLSPVVDEARVLGVTMRIRIYYHKGCGVVDVHMYKSVKITSNTRVSPSPRKRRS